MSLPSANVEVSALVKRFRGVEVLRGVDLTFESGRVSALLGPSGSGKSTLLRCMMGLEEFDAGSVRVGDVTLAAGPARKHAQERRALQQLIADHPVLLGASLRRRIASTHSRIKPGPR